MPNAPTRRNAADRAEFEFRATGGISSSGMIGL
jgi:hypothetical protein